MGNTCFSKDDRIILGNKYGYIFYINLITALEEWHVVHPINIYELPMCLITASKVKPVCSGCQKTVASKRQESLQVIRSLIVIKQKKLDYVLKDN